jgi:hypothetical protein
MRDFAVLLFGVYCGLWGSTWIAFIHPLAPFFLSYAFGFWSVWIIGNLLHAKPVG